MPRNDDHSERTRYEREELVAELLWEYADRLNSGEVIDASVLRQEHPEFADELLLELEALRGWRPDEPEGDVSTLGTFGDYTLRCQIGRGGMGVVYEAWQHSLDRQVALKVLPVGVAADTRASNRFLREAQVAARLSHPQVVSVYGFGVEQDTPYYAMLTGQSPRRLLRS